MVAGTRPAFTISRMSSSSSCSSAFRTLIGFAPAFVSESFTRRTDSKKLLDSRMNTSLPLMSASELTGFAAGPGDEHLTHPGAERRAEVHLLQPLLRDAQVRGRDVTPPLDQRRQELVAHHRHEHDVHPLVRPASPAAH